LIRIKISNKEHFLSAKGSKAAVLRVPTNEELVIALDTADIVKDIKQKESIAFFQYWRRISRPFLIFKITSLFRNK
jgi:hypothetical protein